MARRLVTSSMTSRDYAVNTRDITVFKVVAFRNQDPDQLSVKTR